jgi:hypothetical protein
MFSFPCVTGQTTQVLHEHGFQCTAVASPSVAHYGILTLHIIRRDSVPEQEWPNSKVQT